MKKLLLVPAFLLMTVSVISAQNSVNSREPNEPMGSSASPRIAKLLEEVSSGNSTAVDRFWKEIQAGHAPLVEPTPGDAHSSLVTFLWRGDSDTRYVVVIGGLAGTTNLANNNKMIHLADTDLWYRTYKARNDARFIYSLSPNDSLIPFEKIDPKDRDTMNRRFSELKPDPLNPLPDPSGGPSSYVELSEAPPQPWIVPTPGVPTGNVVKTKFRSTILNNERDIWIYTPPRFTEGSTRYPLVVVFDGGTYIKTVPMPVILDNLISKKMIPPVVAISVANPTEASRSGELSSSPAFADFLAREIVPWMQTNYHATTNAQQIVVGGSSAGGLAAMFAGFRHPEVFGNILSQSGSFWWKPEDQSEPEWLTKQFANRTKLPIRVFLNAGLMETGGSSTGPSILDVNRRLRDVLVRKGYQIRYQEFNGGHEPLNWRGYFSDGLVYLLGKREKLRVE